MINAQAAYFFYDWSGQALVFAGPDGKPVGISTERLQEAGWKYSDAEFRRGLPRIDKSRLARI